MIEQLLSPKGLTKRAPDVDVVADLTGDGMRERIAVFDHFLTICGTRTWAARGSSSATSAASSSSSRCAT